MSEAGPSPVHALAPECKLVATIGFVFAVVATPREAFWAFAVYAADPDRAWLGRADPFRCVRPTAGDRVAVRRVRALVPVHRAGPAHSGAGNVVVCARAVGCVEHPGQGRRWGSPPPASWSRRHDIRDLLLGLDRLRVPTGVHLHHGLHDPVRGASSRVSCGGCASHGISRGHDPRLDLAGTRRWRRRPGRCSSARTNAVSGCTSRWRRGVRGRNDAGISRERRRASNGSWRWRFLRRELRSR